jgi:2-hydroxychromene-2-carboxylate isomerase
MGATFIFSPSLNRLCLALMSSHPTPLHFYFDFISPFGYFASLRVEALAAKHGRQVQWHAMLLGVSVMKVMGLKPLLDTPLKGDYTRREAERYMRRHHITLQRKVDDKMMDPRSAARAFYWIKEHKPSLLVAATQAIFNAYWVQGLDLSTPQSIAAIALPLDLVSSDLDRQLLLDGIESEQAGRLLRAAVEESMKLGVFGSPTIRIEHELFWGVQNFELLDDWLATGGW